MANLFMAVFWALLAGSTFVWMRLHPGDLIGRRVEPSLAAAVGTVLAVYNIVRWWSSRVYARQRQAADERWARHRMSRSEEAPNPDFNFTDEPPRSESG